MSPQYTHKSSPALLGTLTSCFPPFNAGTPSSSAHVMTGHCHHATSDMSDGDSHNVTVVIDEEASVVATTTEDGSTAIMDATSGACKKEGWGGVGASEHVCAWTYVQAHAGRLWVSGAYKICTYIIVAK